ncbi:MAG TPA: response regulator [Gemmataceae bacterium]|jgi:CheY-like chemotaxis protein
MSYPRKLHLLVIEDDSDAIQAYRTFFTSVLAKKGFLFVEPAFTRSFADAKKRIEGSEIYHIVLLDLNLPLATREPPAEGLAPGEQLLEELARRESHPIPVVLVISGKLNLPHPIGGIQDRLAKDFWYGRLVNKGTEQQYQEIENGCVQALKYTDIGIHIRDAGKEWYPTLSPREDDLLRRCVLAQSSTLGVDVRWWSAEPGQSISRPSPNRGPTKVLMGHFLLDDGMGLSLPTFFKFEPAGNSPSVCRDVSILAQKLGHVKVFHTSHGRQRSLIVTQSATNKGVPISFNDYLRGDPAVVGPNAQKLINQVIEQLNQLGEKNEDEVPASSFLWDYLDREAMERAWNSCDARQLLKDGASSPLAVFDLLKESKASQWATCRNCTHGDLNATNIAIDTSLPDNPQAYIFDAAGMKADFEFRDLATLEVTTILFNSVGIEEQLIRACHAFYESDFLPTAPLDSATASPLTRNVFAMILGIRSLFHTDLEQAAYALLVFDAALRQLSGLGIQPSPNKVRNPLHACYLAAWISNWLKNVAPGLFRHHLPAHRPAVSADA